MITIPKKNRRVWYSKDFLKNSLLDVETHEKLQLKGCIVSFKEIPGVDDRHIITVCWDDGAESKVLNCNLDYC